MQDQSPYKKLDWEKISRYLSDEMQEAEKVNFNSLVSKNSLYADAITAAQSDLDLVEQYRAMEEKFDSDAAWKKLQSNIEKEKLDNFVSEKRFRWSLSQIAAVMLAVVGLGITGYLAYQKVMLSEKTITATFNDFGKEIQLTDGSVITLNTGAKISYPKSFIGDFRTVHLSGEAFFSIEKDVDKPFVIITPKAKIKVLGTTFNVNASLRKTEVLVESGKVQLSALEKSDNNLILHKGDMGTLGEAGLVKSQSVDINYLSWKTRKMIFDAVPLHEVASVIERTYGVHIQLPEEASDSLFLTSTFDYEPLDIILESIGKSFNLTYEKNGSSIQFKAP